VQTKRFDVSVLGTVAGWVCNESDVVRRWGRNSPQWGSRILEDDRRQPGGRGVKAAREGSTVNGRTSAYKRQQITYYGNKT